MLIDLTDIGLPGYKLNPETIEIFGKTGKLLNQRIDNYGYKCIYVEIPGISKNQRVHRIVAKACLPNPQKLEIVQHLDNNKLNCHPSNLCWGTYKSNNVQCYKEKRNPGNTKKAHELEIIEKVVRKGGTYTSIILECASLGIKISKGSVTKYKRLFEV